MNGFEKRRQQKKDAILKAALELFAQFGFKKVTINEIADKAQVSPVSIYNYFQNKNNLRREIVKASLDDMFSSIVAIFEKNEPVMDKIHQFFELKDLYIKEYSLEFFYDSISCDDELNQYYLSLSKKMRSLFLSTIQQGKHEAVIKSELSDRAIMLFFDMYLTYITMNDSVRIEFKENASLTRELNDIFFNGFIRDQLR